MRVSSHSISVLTRVYCGFIALREVAEYLAGQTLAVDVETVNFAMHFPRFFDIFQVILRVHLTDEWTVGNSSPVQTSQKRCVNLG